MPFTALTKNTIDKPVRRIPAYIIWSLYILSLLEIIFSMSKKFISHSGLLTLSAWVYIAAASFFLLIQSEILKYKTLKLLKISSKIYLAVRTLIVLVFILSSYLSYIKESDIWIIVMLSSFFLMFITDIADKLLIWWSCRSVPGAAASKPGTISAGSSILMFTAVVLLLLNNIPPGFKSFQASHFQRPEELSAVLKQHDSGEYMDTPLNKKLVEDFFNDLDGKKLTSLKITDSLKHTLTELKYGNPHLLLPGYSGAANVRRVENGQFLTIEIYSRDYVTGTEFNDKKPWSGRLRKYRLPVRPETVDKIIDLFKSFKVLPGN